LIRCEGYIPRPLGAVLRVCTLNQIPYENNHTPLLAAGLVDNCKTEGVKLNCA
jgi:hypothetical protein